MHSAHFLLEQEASFVHSRLGFINTGGSMENKTVIRVENANSSSKNLQLIKSQDDGWYSTFHILLSGISKKKIK